MVVEKALRADLAQAVDPVVFARRLTSFELDPWQAEVLRSERDRICLLACRQAGKSITTAIMALHTAVYQPQSLVLLLSPSLRQSGELFRKVVGFYKLVAGEVPSDAESALRLELLNGSRIVSLPGNETTIRGFSGVNLLVIDEAARVSDELYQAVRPMLAVSKGRLVLLSTPFGKRGFFFETWLNGGPEWLRVKITAEQCPRISSEFLEEERQALGQWAFDQEYNCVFCQNEMNVFSYSDIERAMQSEDVEAWKF